MRANAAASPSPRERRCSPSNPSPLQPEQHEALLRWRCALAFLFVFVFVCFALLSLPSLLLAPSLVAFPPPTPRCPSLVAFSPRRHPPCPSLVTIPRFPLTIAADLHVSRFDTSCTYHHHHHHHHHHHLGSQAGPSELFSARKLRCSARKMAGSDDLRDIAAQIFDAGATLDLGDRFLRFKGIPNQALSVDVCATVRFT